MRIALIFLLTVLFGCASTPDPKEVAMAPPTPAPMDYVRDVIKNCNQLHLFFGTGESPVDCKYEYPRYLTLSLPSIPFHDQHEGIVKRYYDEWCGSVLTATGRAPQFVRIFRREQRTQSISCPEPRSRKDS